ncbi:endonuclease domain-containing protein [Arthrobacter livingstonensis]|uniref:endonuclease domain-containing protein n=1 Tax=Arthrobacter livingstonensis TaxID=670078 RepID=UPI001FE92DCE|nr:endonuclease domain-containing protein [Arthrobacter livingstonensis]
MSKPAPLPLHLAVRPFTVEQARQSGISRSRTRASDLWIPSRGIRVHKSAAFDLLDSCRPYTDTTGPAVVSHVTAAKIHGLYLPQRCLDDQTLHLARPTGTGMPRRRRVTGHRLDLASNDVAVVGGVPVTTVQRTFLDLAHLLGPDELVVIGDQLVCQHTRNYGPPRVAMVELDALNAYIAGHPGARGLCRLREAMNLVRVGADSPPETRLRLIIARSPLPTFVTNGELLDAAGNPLVSPDLVCQQYRTCVEYDGDHHFTPEQQGKDHDRDFMTKSLGWNQVLINKEDMLAGGRVAITKIARMLVQGGWPDPENLAGRSLRGLLGTRKDAL